jgi:hypothetical protein
MMKQINLAENLKLTKDKDKKEDIIRESGSFYK